jgi:hypothetical protein
MTLCDYICPWKLGTRREPAQIWLFGVVKIQWDQEMEYRGVGNVKLGILDEIVNIT